MNLKPIIQSEVSQKEKNKYCKLTYTQYLEKRYQWTYLWGNNEEADIENRIMDRMVGEEGEGGTDEESNIETYTLLHVK